MIILVDVKHQVDFGRGTHFCICLAGYMVWREEEGVAGEEREGEGRGES